MVKDSVIISVSCSKRQSEFLDEKKLSSSELFQEIINEKIKLFEQFNSDNAAMVRRLESMQTEIGIIHQYLDEIGKFDEFRKWRGQYVLEKKE